MCSYSHLSGSLYSTRTRALRAFGETASLKTHDWVTLCGPVIMYAIQGLLGAQEEAAFGMLMEALNRMWAKSFQRSKLDSLRQLVHGALTHASILFPSYQYDIIVHLLHHVVDGIEEYGPPWALAMWAFERLWGVLIHDNQCKPQPATSIMKNVRAGLLAKRVMDHRGDHCRESAAGEEDDNSPEVQCCMWLSFFVSTYKDIKSASAEVMCSLKMQALWQRS